MKKVMLFGFILLATMNFASSQGLSELLNGIDESTILLFAVFIIAFSLLFFSLNKVFKKENTTMSGIISIVIAFMIVYGISKSGFSMQDSLINIGIPSSVLGILVPLIIIAGIIFLIIKLKENSLLAIGGLFIVASFFVYAKLIFIAIGAILIIIRIFLLLRKKGGKENAWGPG